jgi:hypothetical protein
MSQGEEMITLSEFVSGDSPGEASRKAFHQALGCGLAFDDWDKTGPVLKQAWEAAAAAGYLQTAINRGERQ